MVGVGSGQWVLVVGGLWWVMWRVVGGVVGGFIRSLTSIKLSVSVHLLFFIALRH